MTTATAAAAGSRATGARVPVLARPLTSYYLVVGSSLLLVGLGLVMVLSASSVRSYSAFGSSYSVFQRQLVWVVIGLTFMWTASRLPVRFYRAIAWPLLFASFAGLALVLVPGLGVTRYGSTRWFQVGPISVQPSEVAKLALALWGADLLTRKARLLHEWKHLLVPLVPVTALLGALIMAEPDMGTTMTLMAVAFALLWVVGAPLRLFAGLSAGFAVLASFLAVASPYRLARVTSFLDPFADPLTTGYQGSQGLLALASGGWVGVGLGASRQKWLYLPNAHTDYIFAIIGEELGLLGTLFVLLLFAVLGYAGIRISHRARDPFVRLAAAAVTGWLVVQAVVNMGAVTGLLPITGIPLPLISFGGSSLGVSLFAIGMLAAFARAEPGAKAALAARGPGVAARLRRRLAAYYGFGPGPRRRPASAGRPASGRTATGRPATGRTGTSRPATGRAAAGRPATGRPATGHAAEAAAGPRRRPR